MGCNQNPESTFPKNVLFSFVRLASDRCYLGLSRNVVVAKCVSYYIRCFFSVKSGDNRFNVSKVIAVFICICRDFVKMSCLTSISSRTCPILIPRQIRFNIYRIFFTQDSGGHHLSFCRSVMFDNISHQNVSDAYFTTNMVTIG